MFQVTLDKKQERNKQEESDQNLVRAFIMLPVERFVPAIYENARRDKRHKKKCCKNQLSLCKHCGYFSGKGSQSRCKIGYFAFVKTSVMQKQLNAVKDFHAAFGLTVNENPVGDLGEQINMLRYNLMKEENEEYLEAVMNNDKVEIADALGDMLYILCGTIISHGLQHKIEEVFDEIQRSNMSKLGQDGKPIYRQDGKVMKGPNYFKPDFSKILVGEITE